MTVSTKQHMPIQIISEKIQVFAHVHLAMIPPETVKLQVAFFSPQPSHLHWSILQSLIFLTLVTKSTFHSSFLLATLFSYDNHIRSISLSLCLSR
jgi:hypothetical protein